MSSDTYEILAIRYGHHDRRAADNFIGGDSHDEAMPLAYYVWVIRNAARTVVVDTGFNARSAARLQRTMVRPVKEGLEAVGVVPDEVGDVIITHMHYDHAGNNDLFPDARLHLQDVEMSFATGRCMCHHMATHGYDVEDVVHMVRRVYAGEVCFHDGDEELFPGVTLHRIGGHTRGLQAVRVKTARGFVVLASDATHHYAHIRQGRVFPTVDSVSDVLEGYRKVRKLATSEDHIIPGHDPLVLKKYPALDTRTDGWVVRLDHAAKPD